ncbi:MAG: transcription antitermination factor NusB [Coriobacteriia bacterium]|nr:transcription antitermination factor NusB [Coriobacteriia bacterium]
MLERSRARRQALQILYQREITGEAAEDILLAGSYSVEDGEPDEYCRDLVIGVEQHIAGIDELIAEVSENWSVSRMPFVDRNILRVAIYEIVHHPDVPTSVAINEAVELAKVYGTDDSSKFVNGVLGKIALRNAEEKGTEESTDA